MNWIARALAVTVIGFAGSAPAQTYVDNGETVTHDCSKDREVTVFGSRNKISVVGKCKSISVQGSENTVSIVSTLMVEIPGNANIVAVQATDSIYVSGSHNRVRYNKGISSATPSTSDTGNGNKISTR